MVRMHDPVDGGARDGLVLLVAQPFIPLAQLHPERCVEPRIAWRVARSARERAAAVGVLLAGQLHPAADGPLQRTFVVTVILGFRPDPTHHGRWIAATTMSETGSLAP